MQKPVLVWLFFTFWAATYIMSLWALFMTDPTGDGFTRGLNRLTSFVGWQAFSAFWALNVWLATRNLILGAPLWLTRLPGLLALGLILLIASSLAWEWLSKPGPTPGLLRPVPTTVPMGS